MKLVIVRHGDPDYSIDSLTEKGWKEVEYLSESPFLMEFRLILMNGNRKGDAQKFILFPVRFRHLRVSKAKKIC